MPVIEEIIRKNDDNSLSFGNYKLDKKTKVLDFLVDDSKYKAKSFREVTKLKKDGKLVYESIPGTVIHNFITNEHKTTFNIEGYANTQITLELTPKQTYEFKVDDEVVALIKATPTGKINLTIEATDDPKFIELNKK
ncbi:MAG: hypothetical protein BEN19_06110 [Epulopiscium sp. Nuni2H_MBin003]|nr:MAG: hypothetical protein BEN19_06110 [Epulopiscium sp. Nuni2H_MBin003]